MRISSLVTTVVALTLAACGGERGGATDSQAAQPPSVAARLAVENPHRVERLILAWPPTNGEPAVDAATEEHLTNQGATHEVVNSLKEGETIRGVRDAQLARMNFSVLGSVPENRIHQRRTVDALVKLGARELEGCPEPPRPDFPPYRDRFIECMTAR